MLGIRTVLLLCCAAAGLSLSLSASVTTDVTHVSLGGWVEVSWSGVEDRAVAREDVTFWHGSGHDEFTSVLTAGCWLGFYPAGANYTVVPAITGSTADQPLTATAPWRYIDCDTVDTHMSTGSGSFRFIMDSKLRTDIEFALFTGGYSTPVLQAKSDVVLFDDKNAPGQIHIARMKDPSIMSVQWNSRYNTTQTVRTRTKNPGNPPDSPVSQPEFSIYKTRSVTTITRQDFCGEPASSTGFVEPGYFYDALITGVAAGTTYEYSVGDDVHGWSEWMSFKGPAVANPHSQLFAIMLADMGVTFEDGSKYHWMEPSARNTTHHMIALKDSADIVLHAGDLCYATGYESKWDKFLTAIEPLASTVPYMTGKGNHEQDWHFPPEGEVPTFYKGADSGGECGVGTDARFHMPTAESGATHAQGWWSLDQGPVHFVMTATELDWSEGSDFYNWLEKDLSAVDRALTPWVVVFGHRQMWDAGGKEKNLVQAESLLVKYKVDLSLYGHVHYAERTCPMVSGKCVTEKDAAGYDAPIHAVIGNAGQGLSKFPAKPPAYDIYEKAEFGFSTLLAHNATHLTFNFFGNAPSDQAPPLHHTFTIVRKFPRV